MKESSNKIRDLLQIEESVSSRDEHGAVCWKLPDGRYHRKHGPAVDNNGYQAWYVYGKIHRTEGPAIVFDSGDFEWRINGVLHREDGPAAIYNFHEIYSINGLRMTKAEFLKWRENKGINQGIRREKLT